MVLPDSRVQIKAPRRIDFTLDDNARKLWTSLLSHKHCLTPEREIIVLAGDDGAKQPLRSKIKVKMPWMD